MGLTSICAAARSWYFSYRAGIVRQYVSVFTVLLCFLPASASALQGILPYGSKSDNVSVRPNLNAPTMSSPSPIQRPRLDVDTKRTPQRRKTGESPKIPATTVEPETQLSHGEQGGKIQLFGTVEFRRPLNSLPMWLNLLERNKSASIFVKGKQFKKNVVWEQFQREAAGKHGLDLIRFVHSFWNTFPYREDIANWKVQDYWAIPNEFLQKSGDCEDYAIIKYFTLKELGFPPDSMRIVVLRDTVRNLAHAVLVVKYNGDAYVLDNLSSSVLSHTRFRHYLPQYSINENCRWAHLKGRPSKSTANAQVR